MFEGGKFNSKREAIIGFALLVALFLAAILVVWFIFWLFVGIDKTVLAAIIAGLVATFSLIFTYWKERAKAISEAHREKKIEIYSVFFDVMFDLLEKSKSGGSADEKTMTKAAKQWTGLHRGVMFYGSPKVLHSFANFRTNAQEGLGPGEIMRATGRIILAMREDIGLSNKGLDELSVHQIYLNEDIRKMEFLS
jgi:hypothetical protein